MNSWFRFLALVSIFSFALGVSICPSRTITDTNGRITSPNYPSPYSPNTDCTLTIKLPLDTNITFSFNSMDLEPAGDGVCYDSLTIKAIEDRQFCGNSPPVDYSPSINVIELQMESDGSNQEKGFDLSYTSVIVPGLPPATSVCGTRTESANVNGGRVHSPNYPQPYDSNLNCILTLNIPPNKKTVINFPKNSIKHSSDCVTDKLVVIDSKGAQKTICGTGAGASKEFLGDKLYIKFTTSNNDNKLFRGFLLSYKLIDTGTTVDQGCTCPAGNTYFKRTIYQHDIERNNSLISLKFKTSKPNGLLFFANSSGPQDFLLIKLENGNIVFGADVGTGSISVTPITGSLNDDAWHTVDVVRQGNSLKATIDDSSEAIGTTPGAYTLFDVYGVGTAYFLGGLGDPQLPPNFDGCVKDFYLDGVKPIEAMRQNTADYSLHGTLTDC